MAFTFILFVCLCLLFWQMLFKGMTLFFRDTSMYFYPLMDFCKKSFFSGEIPLWNPLLYSGIPQLAILDPSLCYFAILFFIIFPFQIGLAINLIIHHMIAGLGMYFLGKKFGLSWEGRYICALSFTLSGYLISLSSNLYSLLFAASWIPFIFLVCYELIERLHVKKLVLLGCILGLQGLAGRPDISFYSIVLIVIFMLYRLFFIEKKIRVFLYMSLSLGLALLFQAIMFIPAIEFLKYSIRSAGISYNEVIQWSLNPLEIVSLISPRIFGDFFYGDWRLELLNKEAYPLILSFYMGVGTLIFILASLSKIKRREVFFWWTIISIFFVLALGDNTPLFGWFYKLFPGAKFLRYPVKAFLISVFGMSILSGYGIDSVFIKERRSKMLLVIMSGILCFGISLVVIMNLYSEKIDKFLVVNKYIGDIISQFSLSEEERTVLLTKTLEDAITGLKETLLLGAIFIIPLWGFHLNLLRKKYVNIVLLSAIAIDLVSAGTRIFWNAPSQILEFPIITGKYLSHKIGNDTQTRILNHMNFKMNLSTNFRPDLGSSIFKFILRDRELLFGNYSMVYGLHSATGYYAARLSGYENYWLILFDKGDSLDYVQSHAMWAIKYITWPGMSDSVRESMCRNYFEVDMMREDVELTILKAKIWQPRAHFKTRSLTYTDPNGIFASHTTGFNPLENVTLLKNKDYERVIKEIPKFSSEKVEIDSPKIVKETANTVTVKMKTNVTGYLVLADNWYPGWKAYDNGKRVPLLRANFLQKAVRVGPGEHTVKFIYDPWTFKVGAFVSFVTLAFILAFLLAPKKRDPYPDIRWGKRKC